MAVTGLWRGLACEAVPGSSNTLSRLTASCLVRWQLAGQPLGKNLPLHQLVSASVGFRLFCYFSQTLIESAVVLRQLLHTVELASQQLVLASTRGGSSVRFQPNRKCQVPNGQSRCMVLESHDVILSTEEEKALWQQCFTAAPARRREFEPSFPKVERKDLYLGPAVWAESHHGYQVAYTHYDQRCTHGSGKAQKHSSLACRRGSHRGVPAKNAAAPGRRDGLSTREHPEAQPL